MPSRQNCAVNVTTLQHDDCENTVVACHSPQYCEGKI